MTPKTKIEKALEEYLEATGQTDMTLNINVSVWPKNGMYEETIQVVGNNSGEDGKMKWNVSTRGMNAEIGNLANKLTRNALAADAFSAAVVSAFNSTDED